MRNQPDKNSGFTLIELMVTVAIAAIVMGVAIPNFTEVIANNRLTANSNQLVTSLSFARSESIKRGTRVTVCKSSNGSSCATTGDWYQGWIVFTDSNNDAAYNSATEQLLKVQANTANAITMTGNTDVATYISYVSTGQSALKTGLIQAGTIKVCDNRTGDVGINLILNSVGRVRTQSKITCP